MSGPTKSNGDERPNIKSNIYGNDFQIYNYLNKSICIDILQKHGKVDAYEKPLRLVENIRPRKSQGLKIDAVEKYFESGNRFRVYTFDERSPGLNEEFYADYEIDTPEGTTIKDLHIGMITSRWVGANDDFNIGKPGLNAVQGLPWIKIHNYTDRVLVLNNNINISPKGTLQYTGRDHFGVRLGTVFSDQDGIFPDYIFTIPATDVYYGVVSDIQQPLFGGFQLDENFNDDPDEPHHLLENGWMGGPAWGNIPYGFLPTEGPYVPQQDRWGILATQISKPIQTDKC